MHHQRYIGMSLRSYDELLTNNELIMLTLRKDIKSAQLFPVYLVKPGRNDGFTGKEVIVMDMKPSGQLPEEMAVRLKLTRESLEGRRRYAAWMDG